MSKLQDQVVVITGGSAGIGAALAELIATRGAKVVIAARREAPLAEVAARIGERALAVVADVTVRADNARLRDRALERFGHIDAWVCNAGRGISRPVLELTDEDLDDMITTNVRSLLYAAQAIVPHFKARNAGHLVYVSSMLGRLPLATIRSAYSAAKAAATSLVTSLRLELAASAPSVLASTVFPGVVATEFGIRALHGGGDSRTLPGAQPVAEVATVIADHLETPRAEAYTRPQLRELMARYYGADDVGVLEAQPPFTR
ncbi:MAG: SDR family NAD(P)-dependent oxidoreductase [Proteobacteria bacterium]|nr:SDR family NAD(P)-dependent oxidoreductase [Pseudomonadota bacterium]